MSEYIYERPDAPAKVVRDGWNVHIEWDFKQREEIVRCRDCEHYREHEWVIATDIEHVCRFWHGEPTKVEPDGFCWKAERRVDE